MKNVSTGKKYSDYVGLANPMGKVNLRQMLNTK